MTDSRSPFGHSLRQAAFMAFQIAIAALAVGLLAALTERHNLRFDLTPTKEFVLSDEALNVAKGVQKPVRITVFFNSQQQEDRRQTEDLLNLFEDASPMISSRLLDLDRNPRLAGEFGISAYN